MWDRNDWIAAALIIVLVVVGLLGAAMLLGWMPSVNDFFKFADSEEVALSVYSQAFY
jgi:type II secretory pathway pseudopilin PulG